VVSVGFWTDRRVLVTGATGLLGSWLTEALLERSADVVCLVRDQVPDSRLVVSGCIGRVNVVRGELEDYAAVLRAVNEYEVDSVFHLGAQTIVGTAARSALSTFESNVRGTWNLLEACRQCSTVERVLVASSDKAYGEHETLPYTEETALAGRFPYDVSKSCTDLIALSYHHTYGTPVVVTRCGNLYGGGDLNWNRLVPGVVRWALRGETPIIRSDGQYVRDWFYVRDAVGAYLALAERLPERSLCGEAFNFGTETPTSVIDMTRRVLAAAGRSDLQPRILGEASREIRRQYLDCAKARRRLGWKPAWDVDAALRETVEWYRTWLAGRGSAATSR
jgi:CDP-glucose 4,6-dehydratase